MATRRTPDEIVDIVNHCVELEESGGDILAYLWSENYVTPRATWCNFQREWLGRKPYEYTDGKPKQKGVNNMAGKRIITDAQKLKAVEIAISGGSPCNYLKSLGAKNPSGMWHNIKHWFSVHNPELYAKIPKKIRGAETPETGTLADAMDGMQDAADKFFGQVPSLKVDGALRIETPEKNRIEVAEVPEVPKITKPVNYDGFTVRAVTGSFGTYHYSESRSAYIDYEDNDGEELSMTVEQWRAFLDELRRAALILGVEL